MKNCINCGAPLHGRECEYCGTEYGDNRVLCSFGPSDMYGTVSFGGNEYECYLGRVEIEDISGPNAGRDISGRLFRDVIARKHKFTLIEV